MRSLYVCVQASTVSCVYICADCLRASKHLINVYVCVPTDFNDLMELKGADGQPLFLCYKVGMVCEACTKHKRACNHKLSYVKKQKRPAERGRRNE